MHGSKPALPVSTAVRLPFGPMSDAPEGEDFGVRLTWPQDRLADPADLPRPQGAPTPDARATVGADTDAAPPPPHRPSGSAEALTDVRLGVAEINSMLRRLAAASSELSSELGSLGGAVRRVSSQSSTDAEATRQVVERLAAEVRRQSEGLVDVHSRLGILEAHVAKIGEEVSAIRRRTRVSAAAGEARPNATEPSALGVDDASPPGARTHAGDDKPVRRRRARGA